jgi:hypothetical protein
MADQFCPLLIGKKHAARLLDVCPRTIDNLIHDGLLPVRRVRGRTLVPYAALVDFAGGRMAATEGAKCQRSTVGTVHLRRRDRQ